jgi:hypothetical protein
MPFAVARDRLAQAVFAGALAGVLCGCGAQTQTKAPVVAEEVAQALGWSKDVGAIAVGRWGDMIAVDGDPLRNIRELEDVDVVIKGGQVVKSKS